MNLPAGSHLPFLFLLQLLVLSICIILLVMHAVMVPLSYYHYTYVTILPATGQAYVLFW